MKILFANPPTFENSGSFFRPVRFPTFNYATPVMHPPIYLAYAAGYLRSLGYEVFFIDAPVKAMSVEEFILQTEKIMPDIVVFETSTPSFSNDVAVIKLLKEKNFNPSLQTIFLGTHVSSMPRESLRNDYLDAVVLGEYELSLAEYIEKGPVGTAGIAYKKDGDIIVNERRPYNQNIDALPYPSRDLIPNYEYFDPILENPFTFVVSGRGCPYPCSFCNWPEFLTGRVLRKRSPQNIADELEYIDNNYNFKSFLFNDDTFTADPDHALAVAEEIKKRGLKLKWGCYARADFDNEKVLQTLKEAGCFLLKIGIETSSPEIQKLSRKNYDLNKVRVAVKKMLKTGFHVHGTFAFGLPGETEQSIKNTINFAKKLDLTTVQFSIAVPYPGTDYYKYLKKNNYILTDNWDEYMPLRKIYEYPNLSYDKMCFYLRYAYRNYYFRLKYVFIGLKQFIMQPKIFLMNLQKLFKLVFDGKEEN